MASTGGSHWRELDNAAKLFPAVSNNKDTRVFRFYCVLKEEIQEAVLQQALDITMEHFPTFQAVMRKGLFWFYMEKSDKRPIVRKESRRPCSTVFIEDKKDLLFKVTYFEKRINFEVFHAMTDGTGATWFMRELIKNYLRIAHDLPDVILEDKVTAADKEVDSFAKYYSKDVAPMKKLKYNSYQIRGGSTEYGELNITEARLSVKEVLAISRSYHVSMTVFLTAVFLCAIAKEMTALQLHQPIRIMIPVNLRNFFPSHSALNFFGWMEVGYSFKRDTKFEEVLEAVKSTFEEELTQERVAARMNEYITLEKNPLLKAVPLDVKNLGIKIGTKFSERNLTAIFSNMNRITMPEDYVDYIEYFGVYTSTQKLQLCMCSYEDELFFGFTSRKDNSNIERNMFQILSDMGVKEQRDVQGYPEPQKPKYMGLKVFQWWSFLAIAACVVLGLLHVAMGEKLPWIKYLFGAIASMYVALIVGFYKRYDWLKNGLWQLGAVSVMCIIWDIFTGWHRWSVNYVLPGLTMCIFFGMFLVTIFKKLKYQEYMIYYFLVALYGLIPLLLYFLGVVQAPLLSVICSAGAIILLFGLFIFKRKEFLRELHKKFHI